MISCVPHSSSANGIEEVISNENSFSLCLHVLFAFNQYDGLGGIFGVFIWQYLWKRCSTYAPLSNISAKLR